MLFLKSLFQISLFPNKMHLPVWMSEGDPAGISSELLQKSISELVELSKERSVVLVKYSSTPIPEEFSELGLQDPIPPTGLYFLPFSSGKPRKLTIGKPSIDSGALSFLSLKTACDMIRLLGGDLITLPLSKEWVIRSGKPNFVGHTEYLAKRFSCSTYMVMYSDIWKVLVLTTHIPLRKVVPKLKKFNWKKLFSILGSSPQFQNSRIGLCGINPHAGEGGKIGNEDRDILSPVVRKYSNRFKLGGPFPADSMFTEEWKGKFDLILACYHDQGLAPFKGLVGKKGINLTLGLPFKRVSPDHGPAYEIAGKYLASPESLLECIRYFKKKPISSG